MERTILLVSPWLLGGGIERILEIKAPALAALGFRVEVLAGDVATYLSGRPNPVLETLRRARVPVRHLPVVGTRWHVPQRALRVAAIACRRRATVVVGHDIMANLEVVLAKRLLGGRVRAIAEVHSGLGFPDTGVDGRTVARLRRFMRHADGVVAVSEGIRRETIGFYGLPPERVRTIHNFFRFDEIRRLAEEPPACDVPRPFVVGCGRLVSVKGFDDLIRAFARVRRRHRLTLVILGEGPARSELESLSRAEGCADSVLMPGHVANPVAVLARASAFCLSSRFEAFSRVLVEAMAVRTPVIASRCRWGPEEILGGGRYGALYDVGDHVQLADAMEAVLRDRDAAARRAARAAERVEEFSEAALLPRLVGYYLGAGAVPDRPGPDAVGPWYGDDSAGVAGDLACGGGRRAP